MDIHSFQAQALITFLVPFVMQLAKLSHSQMLAWIDQSKPKICVLTSAVAALATTMGIEVVHAPHSLTVSWPDTPTLARGLVTFLLSAGIQFIAQHALYEAFWRRVVPSKTNSSQLIANSSQLTANSCQLKPKAEPSL